LEDKLVEEAFKFSQAISTKKELIEMALKEYVNSRKRKNLKELKGKIKFRMELIVIFIWNCYKGQKINQNMIF
jgi:hypothetical protein